MDPAWRQVNLVCSLDANSGEVVITRKPVPKMPHELLALFDRAELAKYLTDDELAEYDAAVKEAAL
jgi:succinate dehydrogenase / fumarate reductase flavoprotein subunit